MFLQSFVLGLEMLDLGLVFYDFVVLYFNHMLLLTPDRSALDVALVQLLVHFLELAISVLIIVHLLHLFLQIADLLAHPLDHFCCYEHSRLVFQFRRLERCEWLWGLQ